MYDEIKYINYDETLDIYHRMIDTSDGGFGGIRDESGILATLDFVQNDLYYPSFADKLSYIVYHVAASNIDQELLLRIVNCFMNGQDYDEELKIDIANAMSKGKLGIKEEDYEL